MRRAFLALTALAAFAGPALAASEGVIYSFNATGSNSSPFPLSGLIAVGGTLYGTTIDGGTHNYGTIYSVNPDGSETVLHSFSGGNDGQNAYGGLLNVKGVLYGTTGQGGGPYDRGSVFRLLSDGKVQIVYSFSASHADGQEPMGSLIDVNGTLYGTTELGGAYGLGTVFALTPSGSETILHSFSGYDADCAEPESSLVSVNGMLYGTAVGGGPADRGCVFSVTPSGTETVLHFFGSTKGDGIEAAVGLTYLNGELYGVTEAGGAFNGGTVFQMTLTGAESVLYSFPTGSGGSETPLFAAGGLLYGATIGRDTAANYGTVFSITPAGTESVLYSFTGTPDGAGPLGSLAQIGERLYGTTDVGGATNHGSVYSVLP